MTKEVVIHIDSCGDFIVGYVINDDEKIPIFVTKTGCPEVVLKEILDYGWKSRIKKVLVKDHTNILKQLSPEQIKELKLTATDFIINDSLGNRIDGE